MYNYYYVQLLCLDMNNSCYGDKSAIECKYRDNNYYGDKSSIQYTTTIETLNMSRM
jgi:hypothetical protein